jgi:membrane protein DedA with SNARE-associated domain
VYLFADQLGVPLPATPALLAVGALAAVGQMNGPLALALSVAACVLADVIWYGLGRARGAGVLRLLCKISLERDSCVRRTQQLFVRYGVRVLIIARWVPGLGTVAAPLAGIVGVGIPRFIAYSSLGALLWVGTWIGLGYLAGDAMPQVSDQAGRLGGAAVVVLAVAVLGYIAVKAIRKRRFVRGLRIARITPDQLKREIDAGEPRMIVDLRSEIDIADAPYVIPGALRIAPEDLERRHAEIPRDRDVIVYCS